MRAALRTTTNPAITNIHNTPLTVRYSSKRMIMTKGLVHYPKGGAKVISTTTRPAATIVTVNSYFVEGRYFMNGMSRSKELRRENSSSSSSSSPRNTQTNLSKADFDYCVDLIQNRDREAYLCGLLMPAEARKAYFAVRAFNVELASIKSGSVSRQVGGAKFAGYEGTDASAALKIRIQWWKDALDQIYQDHEQQQPAHDRNKNDHGGKDISNSDSSTTFLDSIASSYMKNPVIRVLDYAVHKKQLTRRFLERLLEARELDLERKQPATIQEAVDYADETFASLFYLSLETCGVQDEKADAVAQHAGIGVGLATCLRGAPFMILHDAECSIPHEVIPNQFPYHKLYSYYDGDDNDRTSSNDSTAVRTAKLNDEEQKMLKDAVEQIAALAYSHISMAQELQNDVPKHARACLLLVIPALHYLTKLEKADYDIFDDTVFVDPRQQQKQGNLTLLALLGRSWLTGVI